MSSRYLRYSPVKFVDILLKSEQWKKMATLDQKRKQQRELFKQLLQKYASLPSFQKKLESALGIGARIEQYSSKYKHQSLQILTYQFSSIGNTNHAKILMLSVADHYDALSHELDHLEQTGLGVVMLDKNGNVGYVNYVWDHCDLPPDYKIDNIKYQRKYEICSAALKNDPLYQQMIVTPKNEITFGQILYLDKCAVRPDLVGKKLIYLSPEYRLWYEMGYKNTYSLETNPKTMNLGRKLRLTGFFKMRRFDFSNFVFSDGTSMDQYYKALKEETNWNVQKLKKENSHICSLIGTIHSSLAAQWDVTSKL